VYTPSPASSPVSLYVRASQAKRAQRICPSAAEAGHRVKGGASEASATKKVPICGGSGSHKGLSRGNPPNGRTWPLTPPPADDLAGSCPRPQC
jgi:hypothetical protein